MMHGREKSGDAIVAVKPTNKAGRSAAEPVEPRAEAKGNAGQQSTRRTQSRISVSKVLACIRQLVAVDTRGGRSYGAGGGGCGTFIVHTNRWRLPRGPNQ
jgi:hypothetical protein